MFRRLNNNKATRKSGIQGDERHAPLSLSPSTTSIPISLFRYLDLALELLIEASVERGRHTFELDTPRAAAVIALGSANSNCAHSERVI
jgi:hypothetical protein